MTMSEARLERIRGVTANYFFWQGLRLVPGGLIIVLAGLIWSDWWPFTGWMEDALLIGVLPGALGASVAIGRYYQRVFGEVRAVPRQHGRRNTIKWLVFYPAMIAFVANRQFDPDPVSRFGYRMGGGDSRFLVVHRPRSQSLPGNGVGPGRTCFPAGHRDSCRWKTPGQPLLHRPRRHLHVGWCARSSRAAEAAPPGDRLPLKLR